MRKSMMEYLHELMPFFLLWGISFAYEKMGLPIWPLFALWGVGIPVTHVWLYRGLACSPRLIDFSPYRDSGVPIVVFLWPIFLFIFMAESICFWIGDYVQGKPVEEE